VCVAAAITGSKRGREEDAMRRSTLGAMSPSQLNRRASGSIGAARVLGKQSRLSNVFPMAVASALNRQQLGGPPPPQPSNLPRRSSIHGKAASSQQQPQHVDSRPFNEKSFQHDCIRKLTAYLTTHGYNVAISTKLLAAPSSKEVLNIVQFLFHQLDPGFKFAAKLEEDVPMMFKRVGYPSQISKSALYAAGSPHTWPGLLAALAWLVDLLVYQEKKETADSESAPFDDNGLKLQLEYFNRSYDCYLNGDDDECERLDTIFKQQFEDIKVQLDDKKQKLESLVTEVQNKLQALKKEPSALMIQQSKKAVYLSDITKFDHINSNLQCGLQAAEKKQEERKQELLAMKMEREAILAEIEELRQKIAVQHLNSIDVERMRKEKDVMETNLHQVQNRVHELREAALDNEVQASTKLKELQQIAVDFTKQANK
jgi:kinetochore protein NDC80